MAVVRVAERTGPAGPVRAALDSTEPELLERARAGDMDAFDRVVRDYLPRAFTVALRLMGQRQDAEDLVQEAFVQALRRLDRYDVRRPFGPWFYRILLNRGLNLRRARALRVTDEIPPGMAAAGDSPARQAERGELHDRLHAALQRLPEKERMVVLLFELEGLDSAEIARILALRRGTVRWYLHRARRLLRLELAAFHGRDE